MKPALPFLACFVAALIAFAAGGAQAAGAAQTLGFTLHSEAAATEKLPRYQAATPIAVHVGGTAAQLPATLQVKAHGPDGSDVSLPLVRTGDSFDGTLQLSAAGTWTVALSSQLGSVTNGLANVAVDVVNDDGADLAARCAFALSAALIVGGVVLLLRGRSPNFRYAPSKH